MLRPVNGMGNIVDRMFHSINGTVHFVDGTARQVNRIFHPVKGKTQPVDRESRSLTVAGSPACPASRKSGRKEKTGLRQITRDDGPRLHAVMAGIVNSSGR